MHRADAFRVEGIVIEPLPNGTYRVQLPNGHRLLGFVTRRASMTEVRFVPGERVKLCLTPYDLTSGRILVGKEEN